ncbi:hypothetical protein GF312_17195, partial [Candidatus Poribacteria bacterium]|nr:hypothetical protein [Candidatus Poribacteria bacterium]
MTIEEKKDREIVRNLAAQIVELAESDEYEKRRKRWRDVNALRKPDRYPVWCRPVGCWPELLPEGDLECKDSFYRNMERSMRRNLIKHSIGDDTIFEPWWGVGAAFDRDTADVWGVPIKHTPAPTAGGAWKYDPPLKTEADFDRLTIPTYTYNEERTKRSLERMQDVLGDVMEVRLTCGVPLGAGLGGTAAYLRGLEQLMYDMVDRPDLVHRLMSHLQKGVLKAQTTLEESGLLTLNNKGPMFCSDPPREDARPGNIKLNDLWGHTESQEFQEVSPAMWQKFLLEYQKPILSRYWLSSYGCCEDLTHKIDGVLSIPNLRIFVCSAWTDLQKVVDKVGKNYTIMWREKASAIVFPDSIKPIRENQEQAMKIASGCYVQIVLRELQTLDGKPNRLKEWADSAKEVAAKYT